MVKKREAEKAPSGLMAALHEHMRTFVEKKHTNANNFFKHYDLFLL